MMVGVFLKGSLTISVNDPKRQRNRNQEVYSSTTLLGENKCFRLLWTYESETNHLATDLLSDGERRLLVVSS